jgi:hypothetical protein
MSTKIMYIETCEYHNREEGGNTIWLGSPPKVGKHLTGVNGFYDNGKNLLTYSEVIDIRTHYGADRDALCYGTGGVHHTIPASRVVANKQFPTIEYWEFEELQKKHYPTGVHCAVFTERYPETKIIQERGYEDIQAFILPEGKKLNYAFLDEYVRLADVNNEKINKEWSHHWRLRQSLHKIDGGGLADRLDSVLQYSPEDFWAVFPELEGTLVGDAVRKGVFTVRSL